MAVRADGLVQPQADDRRRGTHVVDRNAHAGQRWRAWKSPITASQIAPKPRAEVSTWTRHVACRCRLEQHFEVAGADDADEHRRERRPPARWPAKEIVQGFDARRKRSCDSPVHQLRKRLGGW